MNSSKLGWLLKVSLSFKELTLTRFFRKYLVKILSNYYGTCCLFQFGNAPDGCENNFLNGQSFEEIYTSQLEGFEVEGKERMVCQLKKSLYGLKLAFSHLFLKFGQVVTSFDLKNNNVMEQCIYLRV